MTYQKRPAPDKYDRQWTDEENARVQAGMIAPVPFVTLDPQFKVPAKYWPGMTVLALSPWNPGAGDGVYTYYASAWNRLG